MRTLSLDKAQPMENGIPHIVKNDLLIYIEQHLSSNLSLEQLANHSGYSEFHLHRMMREQLNEPLGQYIKRKRIESAASLLGYTNYPAALVKELVGYQNDAAFSKAFRQVMGCPPREFRKRDFFNRESSDLPVEYLSLNYRVEYLEDWKALAFPSQGNYFNKSLFKNWVPVKEFLEMEKYPIQKLQPWGITYECPNVTHQGCSRYDAVLSLKAGVSAEKNLFNTTYSGGKFAIFTICAPYESFQAMTLQITHYLLNHTKLNFREGSSYLKYLGDPMNDSPDYLLTEWYAPVL